MEAMTDRKDVAVVVRVAVIVGNNRGRCRRVVVVARFLVGRITSSRSESIVVFLLKTSDATVDDDDDDDNDAVVVLSLSHGSSSCSNGRKFVILPFRPLLMDCLLTR